ncbi:Outer membrane lipoprotein-sorting protein [Caloramator quimbayensis]|uniref:Outer membrane lipoprotein-sorting protein n=2 Tax=Caloramator quimbayensis TaxID=1147123 RepID=A0A1T4XEI8_9CLOT|nr:Outer membrane lipoprotein-sorting protein [Caloramator quimbayensis]
MKSYSTSAHITVYGNKGIGEYEVKQYCVFPDKFRVETIEPLFLKGKVTVFNDGKWKVYHPLIDKYFEIENLRNIDQIVYLGIIQKDLFVSSDSKYKFENKDDKDFIMISCRIPKESEYGKFAVLYLNKDNFNPVMMEIIDNSQNVKVRVNYNDFEYNKDFDDSLFKLN